MTQATGKKSASNPQAKPNDKKSKIKVTTPARGSEFHPLVGLRREVDHLFDEFLGSIPFPRLSSRLGQRFRKFEPFRRFEESLHLPFPSTDMSETEKALEITAELPGMEAKDVEITLQDGTIIIEGEKKEEKEEKKRNFYHLERQFGSFRRTLPLPANVKEDGIEASFDNGVLKITIPKVASPKKKAAKKIGIKKK
jgi:HSP20 family protein